MRPKKEKREKKRNKIMKNRTSYTANQPPPTDSLLNMLSSNPPLNPPLNMLPSNSSSNPPSNMPPFI